MSTTAAPAAPVGPPAEPEHSKAIHTGSKATLFARRRQQTRRVTLPEHEEPYLLTALRPIEVQEVNTFCLETNTDPKSPKKNALRWDPMRPFYFIARSLCDSDGKPMFAAGSAGEQAAWLYGGQQVANFLTNRECNILFDVVTELSGLSDKSAEDAEKNSEKTGTGSSSSTSR
ncbi:MAG: hypothetical protein H0V43_08595 [Gemmatimonadales bacterium]|nr:hypothetical protein [Gemmatimonadales bacterium]